MILVFLFIFLMIGGFILAKNTLDDCSYVITILCIIGISSCVIGFICFIGSLGMITTAHGLAAKTVYENTIKYESLCERLEVINSDYEDVSKSVVIADIAEWNVYVYNTKYWTYNPWTNWYNPKVIADNLEYINMEGE